MVQQNWQILDKVKKIKITKIRKARVITIEFKISNDYKEILIYGNKVDNGHNGQIPWKI